MHHDRLLRRTAVSTSAATAILLTVTCATAQVPEPSTTPVRSAAAVPAPKCTVVADQARIEQPLARFAFRLAGGLPIKVVAIGSSSTFGGGASSSASSYPSR